MPTFESGQMDSRDLYFLMTSLVVPRPIAWISTMGASGQCNIAPYSHFTNGSVSPPTILFCSGGVKDTLRNILETGEFVVNIVSDHLKKEMRITAANWPPEVDEFEASGLSKQPSQLIAPPRVSGAYASLECKLVQTVQMHEVTVVFGEILCFHVANEVLHDGRVEPELLRPVGKLSGSNYSTIDRVERIDLPSELEDLVNDYLPKAAPRNLG